MSFTILPNDCLNNIASYIEEAGDLMAVSRVDTHTNAVFREKIKELGEKELAISSVRRLIVWLGTDCLNYWGTDGDQLAPIGCLNCSRCMYDFQEFYKNGPAPGRNRYFCNVNNHSTRHSKGIVNLNSYADKNHLDRWDLYNLAMKPVKDYEKTLVEESSPADRGSGSWHLL